MVWGGLLAGLLAVSGVGAAEGPPRGAGRPIGIAATPSRTLPIRDDAVRNAGFGDDLPTVEPRVEDKPIVAAPVAAARYEGMTAPGVQIVLRGDGSTGAGLRYLWVQTGGPPALVGESDKAAIRLTVPDAASLEFLLIVSNEAGVDKVRLKIPIEGRSSAGSVAGLKADAGDDQVGVVGRQITLNGGRSEPRGKVGFRWIQTGGPPIRLKIAEGHVFTFVPDRAGSYRFALVVASGNVISEPDEVEVSTIDAAAMSPPRALPPLPPAASAPLPPRPRGPEPVRLDQFVRDGIAGLDGGPAVAGELGQAFEDVAAKLDLYRTYNDAFSELSRRLDSLIPADPARRGAWISQVFGPATTRLVDELRKEGLDLAGAAGRDAPMTESQRRRMAEVFRAIGEGARAASPTVSTAEVARSRSE